jgi:hypothetical protein
MSRLRELTAYARFARGLPGFLRGTFTRDETIAWVKARLAQREQSFLTTVSRCVFDHPASPYLPLFRWAGCEFGDVDQLVRSRGLEATLSELRRAGVYFAFEEFKGRAPVVRGSNEMRVAPADFDNPYLAGYFSGSTSGSTGARTRISVELEQLADTARAGLLTLDAYGVFGGPVLAWREVLPSPIGISIVLMTAKIGTVTERWYTPVMPRALRGSLKSSLATQFVLFAGRRAGLRLPRPEPLHPDDAAVVARWAADKLRSGTSCTISAELSLEMRISAAAREEGLDLTGIVFWGGGEPSTPAKVREIEACGAKFVPIYGSAEIGIIGMGCPNRASTNDNHVMKHQVAVVPNPRRVPGFDATVDAFLLTGLLPSGPKVMLNVESDDYGVIRTRDCGCVFHELGFDEHVSDIFSFAKLTGEGVTLVGSDLVRIIEEDLPAALGGSPRDYQLVEEEDEDGFTRVSIIVSPRVEIADDQAVIDTLLGAMRRSGGDNASALYQALGTLRVRRQEPIVTGFGKVMPLHVERRWQSPGV